MEGKDDDAGKNQEQVDNKEDDKSLYDTANVYKSSNDTSDDETSIDSSEDDEDPLKKKKKPKRCQHFSCSTKLLLTSYACYCGNFFCALHTPPEEHQCDFDYHAMAKKKIKMDNPKIVKKKVPDIWTHFRMVKFVQLFTKSI